MGPPQAPRDPTNPVALPPHLLQLLLLDHTELLRGDGAACGEGGWAEIPGIPPTGNPKLPEAVCPPRRPQGGQRRPPGLLWDTPATSRASLPPQNPEVSSRPPGAPLSDPWTPSPPVPLHRSPGSPALRPTVPPFRGPRVPRAAAAAALGRLAAALGRPCAIAATSALGPEQAEKRRGGAWGTPGYTEALLQQSLPGYTGAL